MVAPALVLHLVVAWLGDEPAWVGRSICLDRAGFVGRPRVDRPVVAPLPLVEQRPGATRAAPALATRTISRRQLEVTPLDAERVSAPLPAGRGALGARTTRSCATGSASRGRRRWPPSV